MSSQPLAGRHILITRAAAQLPALADLVRSRGAIPVPFPCLAVATMPDDIMRAVTQLERFSDVVFTSCNGVTSVVDTLNSVGLDAPALFALMRVAAVGKRTADCLRECGIGVDIVPASASQDGLIDAYRQAGPPRRNNCAVIFTGTGKAADFTLDYATTVEFDGLIKFDFTIKGSPEIKAMRLEWRV